VYSTELPKANFNNFIQETNRNIQTVVCPDWSSTNNISDFKKSGRKFSNIGGQGPLGVTG